MDNRRVLNVGMQVYYIPLRKYAVITVIDRVEEGRQVNMPESIRCYDVTGYPVITVNLIIMDKDKTCVAEVYVGDIALRVQDNFKVGDKVRSTYGRFKGIVTGFEYKNNRVVCQPRYSTTDRTRYAYLVHEVIKEQPNLVGQILDNLSMGGIYQIRYEFTSGLKCVAIFKIIKHNGVKFLLDNNTGVVGASLAEFKKECIVSSIIDSQGKDLY